VTMRRLNRYDVIEIWWLSGINDFVGDRDNLIFSSFKNFKPVQTLENRSDVLEFWGLDSSSEQEHSGCVGVDLLSTLLLCK